jgi:thioredoxin 1
MGLLDRLLGGPRAMPVHVDDANFEDEVMRSELPVMLDVWGPDCVPCRQLEPVVMRIAGRYQGKVKVAEVSAAGAPRTMRRLGVRSTPTLLFFRGRAEIGRVVGFRGEDYLDQLIRAEFLGETPR